MATDLLLISLCAYNIAGLALIALVVFYILTPLYYANSSLTAFHFQTLRRLCLLAVVSGSIGLLSRSLYLKDSVEQLEARSRGVSTSAWAFGTLLTEVAAYVFGNGTRYLLGLQGYLALTAWTVYINIEGGGRRISHLWLFLLLTPIVSFAFAQTLFYVALLLTNTKAEPEDEVHRTDPGAAATSPRILVLVLSCAYLSAFVLPYAYGTRAFLWVFLIAYVIPLILTYLPHRRASVEASWRLVSIMSVVLYSFQLSVAAFSHTARRGQWTLSDLATILYDLQWTWVAHPVTRALGYDLLLSTIALVYWSYVQLKATMPRVAAANAVKLSEHDRTNRTSDQEGSPDLSGGRSAAIVALIIVVAGLGAGSASVYRA